MNKLPVRHYCTYFDSNYLTRGLALHQSLEEHSEGDFRLYVLCLDENVESVLKELKKATIVPVLLCDVEAWDQDLLQAKANRSRVEYYFTLSPVLPLYLLEFFSCDIITYLDADLMFFSSPEAIFDELGDKSIFATEHRFSQNIKEAIIYGRFNVQCQSFCNDEIGISCLQRWRMQCLEWCCDRLEGGRFADQKYLDEWPALYGDRLAVNAHPGIGAAPWNLKDNPLQNIDGAFVVESRPLVFFHFHGVKVLSSHVVKLGLSCYNVKINADAKLLYIKYMRSLKHQKSFTIDNGSLRLSYGRLGCLLRGIKHRDLLWV